MTAQKTQSTDLTILSEKRIADMKCNLIDDFPLHYSTNLSNNRCADNGIIFNNNPDLILINHLIHDNLSAMNYHVKKVCNDNFIELNNAFNQMNRDLYSLNNHINTKTVPCINALVDDFNALEQTVINNQQNCEQKIVDIQTHFEQKIHDIRTHFEQKIHDIRIIF